MRMMRRNPLFNFLAEALGECQHFRAVGFGYHTGALVVGFVSLLAELIQSLDDILVQANREFQGADDPIVVSHPLRLIAGGGQRSRSELQGSIVSNIELPIGNEVFGLARIEVAVSETEQVGDFLPTRLMLF